MSRKTQLLLFGAAILIFFVASQFVLKDQEPTLTVEDEKEPEISEEDIPQSWMAAETREKVTSFFEREIPNLEQAREQGLTIQHDETIAFSDDEDKEMTILESWYNEDEIFLIFKLDAEDVQFDQSKPPRLLENAYVEKLDGDVRDQDLLSRRRGDPAILFDGEIYAYTSLTAIREEQEIETPGDAKTIGMIPAEAFDETVLASFHVHLGGSVWKTEEANLHFSYLPDSYNTETYSFDEDESFDKNGIRYKPVRVENDLRSLRFYLQVETEKPLSFRLDAELYEEEQYSSIASFHHLRSTGEKNIYVTENQPLAAMPSVPKLTLNHFFVKSDAEISFQADTRDKEEKIDSSDVNNTIKIDESLGTFNNTSVTLKEKRYDPPDQVTWRLSMDTDDSGDPYLSPYPFQKISGEQGFMMEQTRHVKIEGRSEDDRLVAHLSSHGKEMTVHSDLKEIGDKMPVTFTIQNLTDAIPFKVQSTASQ
ncbi:hypothetical protein [Salimicrobium halophilum]|uniref:Uncharacterized protein n=1 Tax=Salimicrobium halophilum TaxID=86666 RepID=A0A1G8VSK9_9BACI|nr:hypothetical protein [Salimicrobium halophilum]SDJ68992.1 hypothetical protein SAMN04490247_2874 [Salimicrobium halophilum]